MHWLSPGTPQKKKPAFFLRHIHHISGNTPTSCLFSSEQTCGMMADMASFPSRAYQRLQWRNWGMKYTLTHCTRTETHLQQGGGVSAEVPINLLVELATCSVFSLLGGRCRTKGPLCSEYNLSYKNFSLLTSVWSKLQYSFTITLFTYCQTLV